MFNSDEDMRRSDAENKNENDVTKKNPEPDVREGDSPVAQANPEKTKKKPRTVTVGKAGCLSTACIRRSAASVLYSGERRESFMAFMVARSCCFEGEGMDRIILIAARHFSR